ncbi:hypothetical protein QA640_02655 [Bradyrhizobium sp. CB82]|uniref:hypothetical protein n=1 Tax=Bradyrhizobium sp. CB82 TaxID=3039159 RepID=UPI0024B0461A|nr:hypothetical protein [Bradyrhizobium sp. CB82]WFU41450.1 hypothetical protein QA640_02655 [Bradyrhizobium sp. CB82]
MNEENDRSDAAGNRSGDIEAWEDALTFWRGYTAEMFDDELKRRIHDCVALIGSTIEDWRAAVRGDATAAIKIALGMRMPEEVDARLDLTMTMLLAVAFEDSAAASVMADLIECAPLDSVDRAGLSTSWRLHTIWCESRLRNARRRRQLHRGHGGGV